MKEMELRRLNNVSRAAEVQPLAFMIQSFDARTINFLSAVTFPGGGVMAFRSSSLRAPRLQ